MDYAKSASQETSTGRLPTQKNIMKTLVIGAGFIATHLLQAARGSGHRITVLDHRTHREAPFDDVDRILGDVRDSSLLNTIVGEFDCVINLAGMLGTSETVGNPLPSVETNLIGALNVFGAVRDVASLRPIRCVQITVGNHFMLNTYAITKSAAERFALMYNKEHGTQIAVVRALNAYGPSQKAAPVRKIVPNFIIPALNGNPISVFGSGNQVMDMVYVGDVARVLLAAAESPDVPFDSVLEAGTGRRTTVNMIAEMVNSLTGNKAGIRHLPMRPGEPSDSEVVADVTTLDCVGLSAGDFVSLEDGLTRTIQWYMEDPERWQDK